MSDFNSERRTGIGGSDAAAILGMDPYRTPLDVYLEKIGEAGEKPDTEAMYWGRALEDVVASEFAKRKGLEVLPAGGINRHPEYPFLMGHIDRLVPAENALLECKTAGWRMKDAWGEEGDEVPIPYILQVHHYLNVTGMSKGYIAVLIAGRDFRIFELERDENLEEQMMQGEISFWKEHVEKRIPPDPMRITDVIKLWPEHVPGKIAGADAETIKAIEDLKYVRDEIKEMEELEKELMVKVQAAMKDAEELRDPAGKVLATWKTVTSERIDTKRLKAEFQDIAAQLVKESTYRRFMLR